MFKNMEGNRIPDATFRTRRDHEWVDVTSKDFFDGKTVVVFSLPGAFTPTCSSSHVPRYNQLSGEGNDADANGMGHHGFGCYGLNVAIGNVSLPMHPAMIRRLADLQVEATDTHPSQQHPTD